MKIFVLLLFFVANVFSKSPFIGNMFSLEILTEKNAIKSSRSLTDDDEKKDKDGKTNFAPKSFQCSLSNKTELSKYFVFLTDSFVKLNAINISESSSEVQTKFTKGMLGYGMAIGIGIFTSPINLLSISTFCENMKIKCEDLSNDASLSDDAKKSSSTKFINGFKVENLTAFSKNKFMKISLIKPFNDKIDACGGKHSISCTTIGLGLSVKF